MEGLALASFKTVGSYSNASSIARENRNLASSVTPAVAVYRGGSLEVTSRTVYSQLSGAGKAGLAQGGDQGNFTEFLLPPGIYALDVQNQSGNTSYVGVAAEWYEPNKG